LFANGEEKASKGVDDSNFKSETDLLRELRTAQTPRVSWSYRLMSERSGSGGKIKAHAKKFPRPITAAGHVSSPPTSPDFGGTGLKVMGS
jgi:hypothetical protein